ncbi:MAG: hypothetical protein AAFV53_28645 [Myxococcota bacterium]
MSTPRIHSPFTAPRPASPLDDVLADLRELTGFEEDLIERSQRSSNTAALCNRILACCLVPPGHPPEAALERIRGLLVAQRDQALVVLRQRSLGDAVETRVTCPACQEVNAVHFNLSTLPMHLPQTPLTLSVSTPEGESHHLRLPTAGDQADLITADPKTAAQRRTWLLHRCLVSVAGQTGLSLEAVHALPTRTRRALEGALSDAVPRFDLTMGMACHKCGHAFDVPFDIASFFLTS